MRAPISDAHLYDPAAPLAVIGWILSAVLCLFAVENIWLDPWLQTRSHRVPSFVPQAMGGAWILVSAAVAIAVILLIVCEVLMWRSSRSPTWKKVLRALAALAATLLCAAWFLSTSGVEAGKRLGFFPKHHTVTLDWQPSITPSVKYNLYRSTKRGKDYVKLNDKPISGLTFKDKDVQSGVTYYYVARSVDPHGNESADSTPTQATIP